MTFSNITSFNEVTLVGNGLLMGGRCAGMLDGDVRMLASSTARGVPKGGCYEPLSKALSRNWRCR